MRLHYCYNSLGTICVHTLVGHLSSKSDLLLYFTYVWLGYTHVTPRFNVEATNLFLKNDIIYFYLTCCFLLLLPGDRNGVYNDYP
jgi:hypothetical protein